MKVIHTFIYFCACFILLMHVYNHRHEILRILIMNKEILLADSHSQVQLQWYFAFWLFSVFRAFSLDVIWTIRFSIPLALNKHPLQFINFLKIIHHHYHLFQTSYPPILKVTYNRLVRLGRNVAHVICLNNIAAFKN